MSSGFLTSSVDELLQESLSGLESFNKTNSGSLKVTVLGSSSMCRGFLLVTLKIMHSFEHIVLVIVHVSNMKFFIFIFTQEKKYSLMTH
jgi:hypothetical protein